MDLVHVLGNAADEAEVLAGDKIVPKPVSILVKLPGVAEVRVASSTASHLFGLGNLHAMAVEVMGLGPHAKPQGEGEDDSAAFR